MDVEGVVLGFTSVSVEIQVGLNRRFVGLFFLGGEVNLLAHNGDAGYP